MKLRKIFNSDALQAYSITNPTKQFKLMYPKDYILVLNVKQEIVMLNIDKINSNLAFIPIVGYIFTYKSNLPSIFNNSNYINYINNGNTIPSCLDTYFISQECNDSENIDIIISCTPKNEIVSPKFTDKIIMRCNTEQLLTFNKASTESKTLKRNILNILNNVVNSNNIITTEEWVNNIITHFPTNDNGLPVKYPNKITNKLLKEKSKIKANQIQIGYDFHAKDYEYENKFINLIEESFENDNENINIYDTYNGLLDKITNEMDHQHIKYTKHFNDKNDKHITTTIKNIRKLNMTYALTDFI